MHGIEHTTKNVKFSAVEIAILEFLSLIDPLQAFLYGLLNNFIIQDQKVLFFF